MFWENVDSCNVVVDSMEESSSSTKTEQFSTNVVKQTKRKRLLVS